ncbi:putative triacylglycerol lipase [Rosa chinensis]|uniref:Putative triacylglycerol lipase n=1 Tax=Rosa chinensis TaxID=74649 RepID=A0A2P6QSV4_ROSCH|nr:putative triacylglycerol lipase [Rosa chinensis]
MNSRSTFSIRRIICTFSLLLLNLGSSMAATLREVAIKALWVYFSVLLLFVSSNMHYLVDGASQVPCYFIFGDSLSDSGNNNGLLTLAEVNYRPYGIDFPQGPTGRFSNGRNLVDIIAELLGFDEYIPTFAAAIGGDITKGVNYASGAAGIRDESGRNQGMRITLYKQLINHQIIVNKLVANGSLAADYLSKCIYSIGIGANDYINNYFMPKLYPTSRLYTPKQYADVLVQEYSQQLRTLYNSGARKMALIGLGMIGSTPFEVAMCGTNGTVCVDNINNAAQLFNARLKSLVTDLNTNLTNAKFIYIDYYGIGLSNAASSPPGAVNYTAPCCEVEMNSTTGLCTPFKTPCQNRTQYAFWDSIHPTEISNVVIAARAYNATLPTDAFPYDISHLAQM